MLETLRSTSGVWPYLLVLVVGFIPTEMWRVIGVAAARRVDPNSEILVWVQAVATALVAEIVGKIMTAPPGALAHVGPAIRFSAIAAGLTTFFLLKRRIFPALLVGEAVLIVASLLFPT